MNPTTIRCTCPPRRCTHPVCAPWPAPTQPPAYPIPADAEDQRFGFTLIFDLVEVLLRHGYPQPAGSDWAHLLFGLDRIIYQQKETP